MRAILHVDMDAFYASVEIRDDPRLRGKPVAVGGAARRGVIAAASYEARKYGVHSAMPAAKALRLCPNLIMLPVRMAHYARVSRQVFEIFHEITPLVEGLSLDEAFLDVTASRALFGSARQIAERIRHEIHARTQLTASAGVAGSKFVAKLASDLKKPDGLVEAPTDPDALEAFLAPLPLSRMWGIGEKSLPRFEALGLRRFGDLQRADPSWLERALGDGAARLQRLARGQDDREVVPDREAKSVGGEQTFDDDRVGWDASWTAILEQASRVATRLQAAELACRVLTLKLRSPDFATVTLRSTLPSPVSDLDSLATTLRGLLQRHVERHGMAALRFRLVGVSASGLSPRHVQAALFPDPVQERRDKLGDAVRAIEAKSGQRVVRASLLREPRGK